MTRPAVAVVMAVTVLVTAGCAAGPAPGPTAGPGSAATSEQNTDAPTYPPYERPTLPPADPAHLRTVPRDAVAGTAYPVDLWAHCGIDVISVVGAAWRAERPLDPNGMPSIVTGTIALLDSDTARLVIDQQYYASPVEVVMYHRTAEGLPRCA